MQHANTNMYNECLQQNFVSWICDVQTYWSNNPPSIDAMTQPSFMMSNSVVNSNLTGLNYLKLVEIDSTESCMTDVVQTKFKTDKQNLPIVLSWLALRHMVPLKHFKECMAKWPSFAPR